MIKNVKKAFIDKTHSELTKDMLVLMNYVDTLEDENVDISMLLVNDECEAKQKEFYELLEKAYSLEIDEELSEKIESISNSVKNSLQFMFISLYFLEKKEKTFKEEILEFESSKATFINL